MLSECLPRTKSSSSLLGLTKAAPPRRLSGQHAATVALAISETTKILNDDALGLFTASAAFSKVAESAKGCVCLSH